MLIFCLFIVQPQQFCLCSFYNSRILELEGLLATGNEHHTLSVDALRPTDLPIRIPIGEMSWPDVGLHSE